MKRDTIVGLIAMIIVVVVALSAGCNGPPSPTPSPTASNAIGDLKFNRSKGPMTLPVWKKWSGEGMEAR